MMLPVFGMAILATVCCSFISVLIMSIFTSVFSDIIYLLMAVIVFFEFVYSAAWKVGDKDATAKEFDKDTNFENRKGLYAGLCASIPFVLTSLLLVIPKLGLVGGDTASIMRAVFRLLNCYIYPINNLLLPIATEGDGYWLSILAVTLVPMLLIGLSAGIGYFFGLHRISLYNKIIYKKR